MTRIAKRPTKIHNGMCEHGAFDGCPHGCFDHPYDETFDEFQRAFRSREFCIGWHPVDDQKKTYYQALFDTWHEANQIASGMQKDQPGNVFFVEAVLISDTKTCPRCHHGRDEGGDTCAHCHGKGRIRN